jgi:hypothetical protein
MTNYIKNHGVILGHKKRDWKVGGVDSIPYEVRNPSGDWTPFLVRTEKQWFPTFDTMACVSFSANNICEIQIKHQTGVEVNFSDRFLAKMSGTTHKGNWLYIVGDTLMNDGGVLEEEWPVPPEPFGWDDYYVEIPQFVKDRAQKQFKDKYQVNCEWVPVTIENFVKHFKHAPLQLVIPGHAIAGFVAGVGIDGRRVKYFDTYDPFIKEVDISEIQDAYKILLTVKGNKTMIGYKKVGDPTVYVGVGNNLVPIANWGAFTALGGSTESVIELSVEQFAKFNLASSVLFKSNN